MARKVLTMALSALCLTGCMTKIVTVPEYHVRDSVRTEYVRDSVFLRDSVYVSLESRGDTVFLTKAVTKYAFKDRLVRDTVAVVSRDSVVYAVERQVTEYSAVWYDRVCRWAAALAALAAAVWAAVRIKRRRAKSQERMTA